MLQHLPHAALVFGIVACLFGFLGVRIAKTLEAQLAAVGRLTMALAVALVALSIGVASRRPEAGLPLLTDDVGPAAVKAHLEVLRAEGEGLRLLLGGLALLLAAALPTLRIVLRDLGGFVLAQRLDLIGRDQAAGYSAPKG